MELTKDIFHNSLRVLLGIDAPEFWPTCDEDDLAFFGRDKLWQQFRDNPFRFFIRCPDRQADKLFAIVVSRQGPAAHKIPDKEEPIYDDT